MVGRGWRRSGAGRAVPVLAAVVAAVVGLTGCTTEVRGRPAAAGAAAEGAAPATGRTPADARPAGPGSTGSPACGGSDEQQPVGGPADGLAPLFEDRLERFAIHPPAGWVAETEVFGGGTGGSSLFAVFLDPQPPAGSRTSPAVAVNAKPWSGGLAAACAQAPTDLAAAGFQVLGQAPITLADGTPAQRLEATGPHAEVPGVELRNVQVVAVHDSVLYVVTAVTEAAYWPQYEARLAASAESVRFDG